MKNGFKFKVSEGCMKITPDGEKEKLRHGLLMCDVLLLYTIESYRLPVCKIHCDFCKSLLHCIEVKMHHLTLPE